MALMQNVILETKLFSSGDISTTWKNIILHYGIMGTPKQATELKIFSLNACKKQTGVLLADLQLVVLE